MHCATKNPLYRAVFMRVCVLFFARNTFKKSSFGEVRLMKDKHFLDTTPASECPEKCTHALEMPIRKGKEKAACVQSCHYSGSIVGVLKDS